MNVKKVILSKKVLCLFTLAFLALNMLSPAFASGEKFENWTEVADAMSVHLNEAVEIYQAGGDEANKEATAAINVAYFKYYEKIGFEKTVMSKISGERGSSVEHQFYKCKRAIKNSVSPDELNTEIQTLITMLHEDAEVLDAGMKKNDKGEVNAEVAGFDTFIFALGLTLREGLEAILVVAAIVAYLVKTNNKKYLKSVYMGAVFGIVFSIILALIFNTIAKKLGESSSGIGQEVFEGVAMFVAVIVLFYVSNWMLSKSEVEVWNQYIQDKVEASLSKGSMITLAFTSFIAVAREGAELILFFQGMLANSSNSQFHMWLGIVVSVIILAVVYFAINKLSVRLPLKPFFVVTSWLMFILCISFAGKGVYEFQEAGIIGRTIIPWMNGFTVELLGIYDRVETITPQIILLLVTIVSVIWQTQNNRKMRAELESKYKKKS